MSLQLHASTKVGLLILYMLNLCLTCLAAPGLQSLSNNQLSGGNTNANTRRDERISSKSLTGKHIRKYRGHRLQKKDTRETRFENGMPVPADPPVPLAPVLAPPDNKGTQTVPSWEAWLGAWERSHDNCGSPETPPRLRREFRVATNQNPARSFADPGNYPWMVSLKVNSHHWCGGVLISDEWVLTATHCLFSIMPRMWGERTWKVHLGSVNITASRTDTEQVFNVSRILVHPGFDKHMLFTRGAVTGTPSPHDIALIKLSARAKVNSRVSPVCLPKEDEAPQTGKMCVVTGWGYSAGSPHVSARLKQGQVPIMDHRLCQSLDGYRQWLTPVMLCAGYWAGGVDACKFDSGGPLQCKDGDKWVVKGIVSWGDKNGPGCAQPLRPGVYTRVDAHVKWIQESIYADFAGIPQISWNRIIPNPMLHPY